VTDRPDDSGPVSKQSAQAMSQGCVFSLVAAI